MGRIGRRGPWLGGLVVWTLASTVAGPQSTESGNAPEAAFPGDLEGIALGDSFTALEPRLDLMGLVPLREKGLRRYVLDTRQPLLPDQVAEEFARRAIHRLEIVFRGELVSSVRVEYADRREVLFDEMGAELRRRFGEPADVQDAGPLAVGRRSGIRLSLWLRIWTWQGDGRSLVVQGKHYGDAKEGESPDRHAYVFTLASE